MPKHAFAALALALAASLISVSSAPFSKASLDVQRSMKAATDHANARRSASRLVHLRGGGGKGKKTKKTRAEGAASKQARRPAQARRCGVARRLLRQLRSDAPNLILGGISLAIFLAVSEALAMCGQQLPEAMVCSASRSTLVPTSLGLSIVRRPTSRWRRAPAC